MALEITVGLSRIQARELPLLFDGHCLRDEVYESCHLGDIRSGDELGPRTPKNSLATIPSLARALVLAGIAVVQLGPKSKQRCKARQRARGRLALKASDPWAPYQAG